MLSLPRNPSVKDRPVSSLADLPEVISFFSYSQDDEDFLGTLSALRSSASWARSWAAQDDLPSVGGRPRRAEGVRPAIISDLHHQAVVRAKLRHRLLIGQHLGPHVAR
jgi:hypothetical protein